MWFDSIWFLRFNKRFFRFYCSLRSLIIIIKIGFSICRFISRMLLAFRTAFIIINFNLFYFFLRTKLYWIIFGLVEFKWIFVFVFFNTSFWKRALFLFEVIWKIIFKIFFSFLFFNILRYSLRSRLIRSFPIRKNL